MRILYLSQSRIPSDKANSVHVMKMCSALSKSGHQVTLTGWSGDSSDNPFELYDVEESFTLNLFKLSEIHGETILLGLANTFWLLFKSKHREFDLIYSRNTVGTFFSLLFSLPIIYEIHLPARTAIHKFMERRILTSGKTRKVAVISQALKRYYMQHYEKEVTDKLYVLPDAADPFNVIPTTTNPLPGSASTKVGYIGHLYKGKGGELITSIADLMPEVDFHIVGGRPNDIKRLKGDKERHNLFFHGQVPHKETKHFLQQFDIALAPYAHRVEMARTSQDIGQWMSPLKIFEYMAAGKPIVCSKLPALEDAMTDEENCLMASPDCPAEWREKLDLLRSNHEIRHRIANNAKEDFLGNYTWQARAMKAVK